MRNAIYCLLLIATPMLVIANDIPRFDVEGHCEEVSQVVGGSHQIFNTCVQSEQRAYNALKPQWPNISGRIRGQCQEVAEVIGGSYEIMQSCVQSEQSAAGQRESFSFD
jgi:hypothetical protein